MIFNFILQFFVTFINAVFSILPQITELPFGLDSILTTAVQIFNGAMTTIPYLQIVWTCFLWLMGFEIFLYTMKLFMGSRAPAQIN